MGLRSWIAKKKQEKDWKRQMKKEFGMIKRVKGKKVTKSEFAYLEEDTYHDVEPTKKYY